MKIESFGLGLFDETTSAQLNALLEAPFETFERQILAAGLDPAVDLQHANLNGVDFSFSDLTGYNFSGADLRGATGVSVKWDKSTKFDGTELQGSIFALPVRLGAIFEGQKARLWLEKVGRLETTQKILWTADHLMPGAVHNDVAMPVAEAIFWKSEDAFLRSQLLFFMAPRLKDDALKELLMASISAHADSGAIIINSLAVAQKRGFLRDPNFRSMLRCLLRSPHPTVREKAMAIIVRNRPTSLEFNEIYNAIREVPGVGVSYVREVARLLGEEFKIMVANPVTRDIYPPGGEISPIELYLMARRWLKLEANTREERKGIPLSERTPSSIRFSEEEIRERMRVVIGRHVHFQPFGIVFRYHPDLPDQHIPNLPVETDD